MNPTGLAGSVAAPVVAVVADEKFNKFRKNCCHALVGRFVPASKNSLCGYGFTCGEL
jgi:hypothetical protein